VSPGRFYSIHWTSAVTALAVCSLFFASFSQQRGHVISSKKYTLTAGKRSLSGLRMGYVVKGYVVKGSIRDI